MSNELKRVGLVFTQEGAVDFKKTLQDINIEMNKNYNQFKLTQSQWDKSTSSTEKLRQEQEYLRNAYEIQADRVSTLRMQLSDLENAENKNTTAIKKKQNELTAAEIKMESYKKKIKDVEGQLKNGGKAIEEFGSKIQESGKIIEGAGKKVSAFSLATGTAMVTSAKTAIDFEEAFTGVEKTVDGTAEQMVELKQGIRDMAKEIPSSTTEISAVAEAAGQLGIKTEDILSFTRVMIDLGNSTNLSAEEAASSLAKFANVTKMSAKDYDKLGATIVELGNNFATTEKDIVEMATRLAATGELAGLSQPQILSLATAMSSVGIEAEAGGSAMSKLLKKIQLAVELGGDDLKQFAKVAGMSVADFKKAYEKDAVKALSAFIGGLNDTKRNGKSAIAILKDMDLTEVRLSNTILSLANASDVMNKAVDLGNEAWEDNTALTNEANKRYGTLKSQITIAINKIKDLAITFGNKMMPTISKVIKSIESLTEWISNLSNKEVETILKIGAIVTATGPLLTILGKVTSTIGGTVKGIGAFVQAWSVAKGTITSTSTAVNGLATVITALKNPAVLAIGAITILSETMVHFITKETEAEEKAREFAEEMLNARASLEEYNRNIDETTKSNLIQINSSAKLREELKELVDENGNVKKGYEARVSFILNELNKALGTEYELNGNIIEGYKELQGEIDKLIKKKRAEVYLKGGEEKYTKALGEQEKAVEDLRVAEENLKVTMNEYGTDLDGLKAKAKSYYDMASNQWITGGNKKAIEAYQEEADSIQRVINAYEDADWRVEECTTNIRKYEKDYEEFCKENYDKIGNTVITKTENWCEESLQDIKNSIQAKSRALDGYKSIYEKHGNDIAKQQMEQSQNDLQTLVNELKARTEKVGKLGQEEVEAWKTLATESYITYYDVVSNMHPTLASEIQKMTGVTLEMTPELVEQTRSMVQQTLDQLEKNPEFKQEAKNNLLGMLQGLRDEELRELLKQAGIQDIDKFLQGIRQGNISEDEAINILKGLNNGLNNRSWQNTLFSSARNIASRLANTLSVKVSANAAQGIVGSLPGHKDGLDYVPKDNYIARLHKGERVLTKEENKEYTSAEKSQRNTHNSNIIKEQIDYNKMANAILKALTGCRFSLDEDGFAKIVKNELYKVV